MTSFKKIYDFRDDNRWTLLKERVFGTSSAEVGRRPADGLIPGTRGWFKAINNGTIPAHKINGVISRVYMTGHNDFPEFEIDSDGIKTTWVREGDETKYISGRQVVLTYAEQKLKNGHVSRHIIEVKISTD
jgi:hypothetical protein